MKTQTSHPLSLVLTSQNIFSQNFKTILSSNSMRPTHPSQIAFSHFHMNLMKYISHSIETCFSTILHENIILWSHVQIFSFWSKFHLLRMKLVVQPIRQVCEFQHFLNSNLHEKRKTSTKTSQNSHWSYWNVFNTSNFRAILL